MTRAPTAIALGLAFVFLASCGDQGGGSPTSKQKSVELTKGPPLSASLTIRNCLNAHGYEGRAGPVPASDMDAPDAAVFFQPGSDKTSAGEIGIYATDAEASRKLAKIEADAKSSGVVVAPHGLATVIYYTNPADATREDIDRCLSEANSASSSLTGRASTPCCSSTSRTSSTKATPKPGEVGRRTCLLAKTMGDFDGDGTSDAATLIDRLPARRDCTERATSSRPRRYQVRVKFGSGGTLHRSLKRCGSGPCELTRGQLFTATDLRGNGRSELALKVGPGAVIQMVGFFRVGRHAIHPLRIAPERTGQAHLKPGPAILGGNFDASLTSPVACQVRPDGSHVLIQITAQPTGNSIDGPWRIERVHLELRGETLHVVRISTTRTRHGYHGPLRLFRNSC